MQSIMPPAAFGRCFTLPAPRAALLAQDQHWLHRERPN
jgi:hypothetical protein